MRSALPASVGVVALWLSSSMGAWAAGTISVTAPANGATNLQCFVNINAKTTLGGMDVIDSNPVVKIWSGRPAS